jgi:hypothetical protein
LGIAALLAAATLATLTRREKAALLVVSGPHAATGMGGVLVQPRVWPVTVRNEDFSDP